jgi:hypothetical protein
MANEPGLSGGLDPISNRIARIRAGGDPQAIGRMRTGWAILSNQQPAGIEGCCMLLPEIPGDLLGDSGCGPTPAHLNDLPPAARAAFLADMALLGDVVTDATGCERLNYLMLCNHVPVLHAHIVPRFASEDAETRLGDPFAVYDFPGARRADAGGADAALFSRLREAFGRIVG